MEDTIAALSTPALPAAIGVIRVSGPGAFDIAAGVFSPDGGGTSRPRMMTGGAVKNAAGEIIDRGLAVFFRAPRSFTGEDLVELHCHGSPAILAAALAALYVMGARPAEAGEFTRRAYLNGKLDLVQVEAVADLIQAETETAAVLAAAQLGGSISRRVGRIYDELLGLLSHFQALVDYPEEDIDPFGEAEALEIIRRCGSALRALAESYLRGQILKEGAACAIIGRPNAGKSSLLNALLGEDRVIVTPDAGTTRDVVEVKIRMGSTVLRLLDTAGIRHAEGPAEKMGVERSLKAASEADLCMLVLDRSEPLREEDRRAMKAVAGKKVVVVLNKSDLPERLDRGAYAVFSRISSVCARTGEGLRGLERAVEEVLTGEKISHSGELLTNVRQQRACAAAAAILEAAAKKLREGISPDMALYDVEEAAAQIAEMLGKRVSEDVLNQIFERFCVGK